MNEDLFKGILSREQFHENVESLDKHLNKFCKREEMTVFHEIVSLDFHLDVFFIQRKEDNFNILLTSGMSLLQMKVPEVVENPEEHAFTELMILIPKEINFDKVYTSTEENSWIISMLKNAARLVHHNNSWLGIGHTLQATNDLEPYAEETAFAGCVVLPSITFDDKFTEFYFGNRKINIYSLFPLYKNELEYKLVHGYSGLLDLLIKADAKETLNLNRKNLLQ